MLIETFQQQYATLREQYFAAEMQHWWSAGLAWLEQRFPGLQTRLAGHVASAPAFFTHLSVALAEVTDTVTRLDIPVPAKSQVIQRLVQTYWLL